LQKIESKRSLAARKGWETRRNRKLLTVAKKEKPLGLPTIIVKKRSSATIIKWFVDVGMSQIYDSGLEFAFISSDGEQCHAFAYCKDYLQDAIFATLNKKAANIYGFTYKYGVNPPLDLEVTRLAVRHKGRKDLRELCANSGKFIQLLDKAMGFQETQVVYSGNYKDGENEVFSFIGDKRWMHSPVLISLYSLAIRVGLSYTKGDWRTHFEGAESYLNKNDKRYTEQAKEALDKIIGKRIEDVFAAKIEDNYPAIADIYSLHNNSGIVAMGKNNISDTLKKNWLNK
jgi:hypothetical protein